MSNEQVAAGSTEADAAAQAAAASAAAATQTAEAKAAADAAASAAQTSEAKAAADKAATDAAAKAAADAAAQTPEAKAAKAAADAAAAAKSTAPEKYEFVAPEGTKLDESVVTVFSDVAKELGLPQDKAQAVIDKMAPAIKARDEAAIAQVKSDLLSAAKADKEIGGEAFDENVAIAKLAMDAYFSPDFAKFLNDTGLGNHPEMIRGLRKAGIPLKPDGWVHGSKQVVSGDAQSFYSNSKMNP